MSYDNEDDHVDYTAALVDVRARLRELLPDLEGEIWRGDRQCHCISFYPDHPESIEWAMRRVTELRSDIEAWSIDVAGGGEIVLLISKTMVATVDPRSVENGGARFTYCEFDPVYRGDGPSMAEALNLKI